MNKNNILLAAIGGAAIGALVATYLYSEQGKQLVNTASDALKDLTDKATEFAKNNIQAVKDTNVVQPS